MLKIEEPKMKKHEAILMVLIGVFFALAIFVMITMLLILWDREMCGQVSLTDYTSNQAPSKCQILWQEGKI